jgi:TolA-binding protein
MRLRFILAALALPAASFPQNKFEREMQRDIALLQSEVRDMKKELGEKLTQLTTMADLSLKDLKETNRSVTEINTRFNDKLTELTRSVAAPTAAIGTKVDQMSTDFVGVSESMKDVLSRLRSMEQKMNDLKSVLSTIKEPPAPPPGATANPASSGPPPAAALFDGALRDKNSGKPENALQGFQEFLKYYAATERAPLAYFYLGQIYHDGGDLESARKNFEASLEFDKHDRTQDAYLMLGKTLLRMGGKRDEAVRALRKAYAENPRDEAGASACAELKSLAMPCATPAQKSKRK